MVRKSDFSRNIVLGILAILAIVYVFFNNNKNITNKQHIAKLTDKWINALTIKNDPVRIANLFCRDASLFGSVSQTLRSGREIGQYFNYFANVSGIRVLDRVYNIQKISDNIYLNSAIVTFIWNGLEKPVQVRVSILFKDNCILHLHGSGLPDLNKDLRSTEHIFHTIDTNNNNEISLPEYIVGIPKYYQRRS